MIIGTDLELIMISLDLFLLSVLIFLFKEHTFFVSSVSQFLFHICKVSELSFIELILILIKNLDFYT